ncbi:MAG: DNA-directed RNA polymerase subunit K [Candidatus Aenigmarchaeota archaeon]|nr:DNA-directed RNA polymerase subunit K [Candidatus Aenigmarchaeota archaeon]
MIEYPGLTRFEKTRIISARALQISMGAPVLVKTSEEDPKGIARQEFERGVLPITVKRKMPGRHAD